MGCSVLPGVQDGLSSSVGRGQASLRKTATAVCVTAFQLLATASLLGGKVSTAKLAENECLLPVTVQNLSVWLKLSGILFKLVEVCIGNNEEELPQSPGTVC